MSISTSCPGCNAGYRLADALRDKKVRCKSCSEIFVVRSKTSIPDRDDSEERIQASPRPRKHILCDEEDGEREQPQLRQRPRKKHSNPAVFRLLIVACIALGVLVVGLGGVAAWALTRSRQSQLAPVTVNFNRPAQTPAPPQMQADVPPQEGNPLPAHGSLTAVLTNANISGFGAQMQVTANYRFTSGSPQGRRLFLFVKATKGIGFLQNYYVAELGSIGNQTAGTINAQGMTFGIEQGPFEMWIGEGSNGPGLLLSERELKKISNVVTVASKEFAMPGMPGMPNMPGMPGMPDMRPPMGPPHMWP